MSMGGPALVVLRIFDIECMDYMACPISAKGIYIQKMGCITIRMGVVHPKGYI
jgi:hypothetical protein